MATTDGTEVRERVVHEHRRLGEQCRRVLSRVSRACSEDEPDRWCRDLLTDLQVFEGHLLAHFRHEEEGGFLRDVVRKVPNAERRVAALRREHDQMARELDRLVGILESWERPPASGVRVVRTRVRRLIEGLERHEVAEQHLLQRTYYREYGVGD